MSIGFLLTNQVRGQGTSLKYRITIYIAFQDNAVVWRGPKKNAMIQQFLTDVVWNDRDVLIVDTPPGTSGEHITVMEALKETGVTAQVDGAVLVTKVSPWPTSPSWAPCPLRQNLRVVPSIQVLCQKIYYNQPTS